MATETDDVALMSSDLRKIPEAIKLAKPSLRKIYQNVALSLAIKLLVFGLTLGGKPSLWVAGMADMATCLAVIFNSMILLHEHQRGVQESPITNRPLPLCFELEKGSEDDSKGLRQPLQPYCHLRRQKNELNKLKPSERGCG